MGEAYPIYAHDVEPSGLKLTREEAAEIVELINQTCSAIGGALESGYAKLRAYIEATP